MKTENRKIILLDIDGTLVDYRARLPHSAETAVRKARENGHLVYLVTGRSKSENKKDVAELEVDGLICGNGVYIEDHGQEIYHNVIDPQTCRKVVDWLNEQHLGFYLECNSGLYGSTYFEKDGRDPVLKYMYGDGEILCNPDEWQNLIYGLKFGENLYRDDVNKISFVLHDPQNQLDCIRMFPELSHSVWGGKGELALFGDLGVRGIDKGGAVRFLLEYLGADAADTIAFGDAKSDLPMFACSGYSVAMGNGGAECKDAADYITDDVEQDGLYKAFEYLRLI